MFRNKKWNEVKTIDKGTNVLYDVGIEILVITKKVLAIDYNRNYLIHAIEELNMIGQPYLSDGHFCLQDENGKSVWQENFNGENSQMWIFQILSLIP